MIRDLRELWFHGRVRRRVHDLAVPAEEWRDNVRRFARREGFPVRTALVELVELSDPATRDLRVVPVVYAVRVDTAPPDDNARGWRPSRWEQPPPALTRPTPVYPNRR